MTPDEVLNKLQLMGIQSSRSTLLRFEKSDLIPKPSRGSEGRGKGRFTEYPSDTPYEYFASYILLSRPYRIEIKEVARIREKALEFENLEAERVREPYLSKKLIAEELPVMNVKDKGILLNKLLKFQFLIDEISRDVYTSEMQGKPVIWFFWFKLKILAKNNIEIPKKNNIIYTDIEIPEHISEIYDILTREINHRKLKEAPFLCRHLERIASTYKFYNDEIISAQKELVKLEEQKRDIEVLYNWWFEVLDEKQKKYLKRIASIYLGRTSIRQPIEKKIKELYPSHSEKIIEVIRKNAESYDRQCCYE